MIIQMDENEKALALTFAKECVGTNVDEYAKRGQSNRDKIINDIYIGKLGEAAMAKYLKSHGTVLGPDYTIYGKRKKSFDADLHYNEQKLHIKTQSLFSAEKYGISWILEKRDPLLNGKNQEDLIALCVENRHGIEFKGMFVLSDIRESFALPKLKWFQENKIALYWDDLKLKAKYDK